MSAASLYGTTLWRRCRRRHLVYSYDLSSGIEVLRPSPGTRTMVLDCRSGLAQRPDGVLCNRTRAVHDSGTNSTPLAITPLPRCVYETAAAAAMEWVQMPALIEGVASSMGPLIIGGETPIMVPSLPSDHAQGNNSLSLRPRYELYQCGRGCSGSAS